MKIWQTLSYSSLWHTAEPLYLRLQQFFGSDFPMAEPTNNSAERALRCAVQWRKISFGSRSSQGEVAVARLLTVARTCPMQGQTPLSYLSAAIRSHRSAQ